MGSQTACRALGRNVKIDASRDPTGKRSGSAFAVSRHIRMRSFARRVFAIYRALWTPAGQERLRMGAYSRMPVIPCRLARLHRRTLARRTRVIAVVGSFGKTTTTRAISAALGLPERLRRFGWNGGVALADGILHMRRRDERAAFEVAIADRGQMEGFAHLIRPDIVVVTCIGSEHMTSLGSLEATRAEKAMMVRALSASGLAILNGDDPNALWMKSVSSAPVLTYGFGASNQVRASAVEQDALSGTRFEVHVGDEVLEVHTRLLGRHMVYPILAAIAVSHAEGREMGRSLQALEELEATPNRLQRIRLANGAILVLDAYKSGLETIHAALDTLGELTARRKIVVLGDVEEPPGSQGPIYKDLGKRVAEIAEHVVFVGRRTSFKSIRGGATASGLPRSSLVHVREAPLEVAQALESVLQDGDLVLIKGRSVQHLERVALLLQGGRVTCAASACPRRHDCASCPLLRCPV